MKRILIAILLCAALLTAFAACGGSPAEGKPTTDAAAPAPATFTLIVTLPDGTQNTHEITTEKQLLGEALQDEGLIERDATGMVVKVEGVEASWDNDQAYWSFLIDGTYANHGVDGEIVAAGKVYELKYTKD